TLYSAPARVKLGNTAPVAADDGVYAAFAGKTLAVAAAQGVLANDSDADDDPNITAVLLTGPLHGTLSLATDGSFTCTPAPGYTGNDSFTYAARDGLTNSSAATVNLRVNDRLEVLTVAPSRNSFSAAPNSDIVVTFNHPVSAATVADGFAVH